MFFRGDIESNIATGPFKFCIADNIKCFLITGETSDRPVVAMGVLQGFDNGVKTYS